MDLKINPHELILIGENSFIRLSTDGGKSASTRSSHWRVLWSPAGPGNALFVDSAHVGGVRIYADGEPLARFLQKEIEYLLYKPFGDTSVPVTAATFEREGTPPGDSFELIHAGKDTIRMRWSVVVPQRQERRRHAVAFRPRRHAQHDRVPGMVRDLVSAVSFSVVAPPVGCYHPASIPHPTGPPS